MLKVREAEDLIPIPLRIVMLAVPRRKSQMRQLAEDLTQMDVKPRNLRDEAVLRHPPLPH